MTRELGKNVVTQVDGDTLTITVDLGKTFGRSASGKTTIIATTSGNVVIPGTSATLGLNIYQK